MEIRLKRRRAYEVGIDASPGWWDDACPDVFDWDRNRYLPYNGDGYGWTGPVIAEWRDD